MSRRDYNTRKLSFLGFNTRGDGFTNPDEVQLDTEMEKVFAGVEKSDKFDVTKFTDESVSPTKQSEYSSNINQPSGDNVAKFDEKDYDSHRKDSYPQARPIFKIRNTKSPDSSSIISPTDTSITTPTSVTTPSSTVNSSPTMPLSQIDEPQLSQRHDNSEYDTSSDVKHVQFNKNKKERKESVQTDDSLGDDSEDQRKRRKGRHFQKHRKYSLQDYPGINRQLNSDTGGRRVSVQPEDETLQEADINELTSHRSDDPRGMRRHKIQPSGNAPYNLNSVTNQMHSNLKKKFDHNPHEVFVQLDELTGTGEDREWKETARWIKYEEDLEEGADRWGPAHVAPLSFHSLLNLRRCLETGVVLLDLEEKDLPSVAYRVVEQMCIDELITEEDKPIVLRSLLLKHRHVNEHSHRGFHFGGKRKNSSYTSLQNLAIRIQDQEPSVEHLVFFSSLLMDEASRRCSNCSSNHSPTLTPLPLSHITRPSRRQSTLSQSINLADDRKSKFIPINETNGHSNVETSIDMKEEVYTTSVEDLKKIGNDTIFKRIPVGAEATTVLVGSVDFLEQPTIAFVRLAEAIMMPSITEVPVPVRFLFILLGPKTADLDYHEVGRSIATLMSSKHFHDIAYKAEDRKDLLSAINEFLDDSIVLPPGDWERQALLPFEELKAKKDMIRSRKKKALQAKKKKQIFADEEKKLLAITSSKKPPNPLERTGRPWGGLINDVKRRYPMFKSDIIDGLNTETLAATIFMYFAALSTAITFGGLASEKTQNLIGISETLLSASLVGVLFHLFSGQPLVIIGTTGPLLLFDEALYEFSQKNNFNFLNVRFYIGVWLVVIALVVSAFEGSVLVRLFTRFTQEIFSALITLIYIVETVLKLISVFQKHPLLSKENYQMEVTQTPIITQSPSFAALVDTTTPSFISVTSNIQNTSDLIETFLNNNTTSTITYLPSTVAAVVKVMERANEPNTALFCTILTAGTFALAYYLKLFRNSHFLGRMARRALGDFGVPISIVLFVCIDRYVTTAVYTEKLTVPGGLSPSQSYRSWIVPLTPSEIWLPFVAGVPALLVYILVFMETHISELIVDKPERGLKKGSGLHMDIVLLCFLNMVCGLLGMPWHCAATVRSVTHVSSVTIMSRTHAPGENPHITDVKEQRLSGFFVSLLVGLSVLMAPILREIPMSVLFGVFFYMGIASMSGVQFFERLRLLFMPVKYHPPSPFVKGVPTWKMHIFTIIQILSLAILWTIKSSAISLAFPFFLILMVPLRIKMTKFFTEKELKALDGVPEPIAGDDEPDFYEQASYPA